MGKSRILLELRGGSVAVFCLDSWLGQGSLNRNGCFRWVGDPPVVQGMGGFVVLHCPIAYILYQHIINLVDVWVIVVGPSNRR